MKIFITIAAILIGSVIGFLRIDLLVEKIYLSKLEPEQLEKKKFLKAIYLFSYIIIGTLFFYLIQQFLTDSFENLSAALLSLLIVFYLAPFISNNKHTSFESVGYLISFHVFNNYLVLIVFVFLFIAGYIYKKNFLFASFSSLLLGALVLIINANTVMKANILKVNSIETYALLLVLPPLAILAANVKEIYKYFANYQSRNKENEGKNL